LYYLYANSEDAAPLKVGEKDIVKYQTLENYCAFFRLNPPATLGAFHMPLAERALFDYLKSLHHLSNSH
jgi:hypothetical protein